MEKSLQQYPGWQDAGLNTGDAPGRGLCRLWVFQGEIRLGSPLLRFKPEESLAARSCKQLIKEAAVGGIKSRFLPTSLIAGECARKAVPLPVSVPEVLQQDTAPSPRRSCSLCASGREGRGGREGGFADEERAAGPAAAPAGAGRRRLALGRSAYLERGEAGEKEGAGAG